MIGLQGKAVAILEARRSSELASLFAQRGAQTILAPALEEVPRGNDAEVAEWLDDLAGEPPAAFVAMTGVGIQALFAAADRLGREERLRAMLAGAVLVARGPKPVAALRSRGVRPGLTVPEPYTTAQILQTVADLGLDGSVVAVQLHGGPSPELRRGLEARGASVRAIELYRWALPNDTEPLGRLLDALETGAVDVTVFTSQAQAQHLFAYAESLGRVGRLRAALNEQSLVASVGPVCTRALQALGVRVGIEPSHPRMGALVAAVAASFEQGTGDAAR